jgi:hypothetical protein
MGFTLNSAMVKYKDAETFFAKVRGMIYYGLQYTCISARGESDLATD